MVEWDGSRATSAPPSKKSGWPHRLSRLFHAKEVEWRHGRARHVQSKGCTLVHPQERRAIGSGCERKGSRVKKCMMKRYRSTACYHRSRPRHSPASDVRGRSSREKQTSALVWLPKRVWHDKLRTQRSKSRSPTHSSFTFLVLVFQDGWRM